MEQSNPWHLSQLCVVAVVVGAAGAGGGEVPAVAGMLQEQLAGMLPQVTQALLHMGPEALVVFFGALADVAGRLHAGMQVLQVTVGLFC